MKENISIEISSSALSSFIQFCTDRTDGEMGDMGEREQERKIRWRAADFETIRSRVF